MMSLSPEESFDSQNAVKSFIDSKGFQRRIGYNDEVLVNITIHLPTGDQQQFEEKFRVNLYQPHGYQIECNSFQDPDYGMERKAISSKFVKFIWDVNNKCLKFTTPKGLEYKVELKGITHWT